MIINLNDTTSDDNIASANEIKARGVAIIGISNRINEAYDIFIKPPFMESSTVYPIVLKYYHRIRVIYYYFDLIPVVTENYTI
jgi:hypothetical protein